MNSSTSEEDEAAPEDWKGGEGVRKCPRQSVATMFGRINFIVGCLPCCVQAPKCPLPHLPRPRAGGLAALPRASASRRRPARRVDCIGEAVQAPQQRLRQCQAQRQHAGSDGGHVQAVAQVTRLRRVGQAVGLVGIQAGAGDTHTVPCKGEPTAHGAVGEPVAELEADVCVVVWCRQQSTTVGVNNRQSK